MGKNKKKKNKKDRNRNNSNSQSSSDSSEGESSAEGYTPSQDLLISDCDEMQVLSPSSKKANIQLPTINQSLTLLDTDNSVQPVQEQNFHKVVKKLRPRLGDSCQNFHSSQIPGNQESFMSMRNETSAYERYLVSQVSSQTNMDYENNLENSLNMARKREFNISQESFPELSTKPKKRANNINIADQTSGSLDLHLSDTQNSNSQMEFQNSD